MAEFVVDFTVGGGVEGQLQPSPLRRHRANFTQLSSPPAAKHAPLPPQAALNLWLFLCPLPAAPRLAATMSTLLKQSVKLALVQLACTADKAHNLAHARTKVLEATARGANVVVLPECFNSPYGTKYFPQYAETLLPSPPTEAQSPTFHALSRLAKEAGAYIVGGSIPEVVEDASNNNHTDGDGKDAKKWYNTNLTFAPSGELLATHRKVHLFDIDIPGKIKFRESDVLTPGNKITLVDLPEYGKIAIAICYDIRFPELATIAARKGAFLLLYPGAFNLTTGALHWELQARARAMDNQVFVGLCSPSRDMEADYNAWGHSMVVDPNAEVLGQLDEKEGTVMVELKKGRIEEVRKGIPLYTQRRFDVYPDVSEGGRFKE
jgi:omega-amidase